MKYLLIAAIGFGTLIACAPQTTEAITTDVDTDEQTNETNATPASLNDADIADATELFTNNCISCHYGRSSDDIPGLIDRYSKDRWDVILPKMIDKAELNESDSEKITKYVYWEIAN